MALLLYNVLCMFVVSHAMASVRAPHENWLVFTLSCNGRAR